MKKIFFLLLFIYSCTANKLVQSSKALSMDKGDYLVEVRSVTPLSLNQIMSLYGSKVTITQLNHNVSDFVLVDQTVMQLLCKDMSNADLQNLLTMVGQCAGILELNHYKW